MKQQSAGRHDASLGHIHILSQPVFALTSDCCLLSRKATNIHFIVYGLTQPGLKHRINHTQDKTH
jgi:hypothetical protein